jgi:hypothetical protein
MEIQLHQTTKIVELNGVSARIWEGHTSSGIPVHAYITRIAVANTERRDEFEKELDKASSPSPELEAIPSRLLI